MDENDVYSNTTAVTAAAAAEPTGSDPYYVPEDPYYRDHTIIVKVFGCLSAMGSAYVVCSMVAHRRKKLDRTFDRLLLGLCVSDFVSSASYFLGSW